MMILVSVDCFSIIKYTFISIDPTASQRTLTDADRPQTQDSQISIASSRSTLQR